MRLLHIVRDQIECRIPILTIHVSFILPFGLEDRLLKTMKTAIEYLTGFYDNKKSVDHYLPGTSMCLKNLKGSKSMDRDYYLYWMDSFNQRNQEASPTKVY